jgi:hypothetical protein
MPTFDSFKLKLSTFEWQFHKEEGIYRIWFNKFRDILEQRLILQPPDDLPALYPDVEAQRKHLEWMIGYMGGAVVKVDTINAKGVEGFASIIKHRIPDTRAHRYMGTVMFPFEHFFSGFQMQCDEHGTTGMRETMMFAVDRNHPFFAAGLKQPPKAINSMEEWLEEGKKTPVFLHPADDEKYDGLVPNHPLSRLRRYMKHIVETTEFDREVWSAKPFRWKTREDGLTAEKRLKEMFEKMKNQKN